MVRIQYGCEYICIMIRHIDIRMYLLYVSIIIIYFYMRVITMLIMFIYAYCINIYIGILGICLHLYVNEIVYM